MRVGILGSGLMGGKLGTIFARAGHEVVLSYSRSQKKLEKLARGAQGSARAWTPREAAKEADALLLSLAEGRIDGAALEAVTGEGEYETTQAQVRRAARKERFGFGAKCGPKTLEGENNAKA